MAGTCSKCRERPVKAKDLCSGCYNRAYYAANADKMRARALDWYRNNPEKAKARRDARDPAYLRELARSHYRRNRLACIARRANQKARDLGIAGILTADSLAARIAYFGGRCWICGGPGTSIDHVKPLGRRGLNIPANIRPACGPCNSRRSWEGRRH